MEQIDIMPRKYVDVAHRPGSYKVDYIFSTLLNLCWIMLLLMAVVTENNINFGFTGSLLFLSGILAFYCFAERIIIAAIESAIVIRKVESS